MRLFDASEEIFPGLNINTDKPKWLSHTGRDRVDQSIAIEGDTIEVVDNCVYLGVNVAKTVAEEPEIRRTTTMVNKLYFTLLTSLGSRAAHRETKIKVYKTIIRPFVSLHL